MFLEAKPLNFDGFSKVSGRLAKTPLGPKGHTVGQKILTNGLKINAI